MRENSDIREKERGIIPMLVFSPPYLESHKNKKKIGIYHIEEPSFIVVVIFFLSRYIVQFLAYSFFFIIKQYFIQWSPLKVDNTSNAAYR